MNGKCESCRHCNEVNEYLMCGKYGTRVQNHMSCGEYVKRYDPGAYPEETYSIIRIDTEAKSMDFSIADGRKPDMAFLQALLGCKEMTIVPIKLSQKIPGLVMILLKTVRKQQEETRLLRCCLISP